MDTHNSRISTYLQQLTAYNQWCETSQRINNIVIIQWDETEKNYEKQRTHIPHPQIQ